MSTAALLIGDVGRHRFAFRSRDVWHVERAEHLRLEPRHDGRAGTLMLGNVAVEVFSLADVLGLGGGEPPRAEGHIAVTGNSHGLFGWLADRIGRAEHSSVDQVAPLPALIGAPANRWFEGAVRIDEQHTALLLRPQCINPVYPEAPPTLVDAAPPPAIVQSAVASDPVAVIFKTASLPGSAAVRYAVSGKQIVAIVQNGVPAAINGCARHIRGLTWWRQSIVPVIDFDRDAVSAAGRHERLLIARCGARHHHALIALPIAPEVMMCRPDRNYRELGDLPRPWFASGMFDVHGEPVALLDLDVLAGGESSGARDGDAVLADFLVERAARDAEPMGGALDPPAFGA